MPTFGVLGSGDVGQVLAKGLKDHSYEVRIGSRTPAKLATYSRETGITAGTFAEVGRWGEALVLSVRGSAAESVLGMVGKDQVSDKLIIDTTNPTTEDPPERGVLRSFTGPNESLMERLQLAHPAARFVTLRRKGRSRGSSISSAGRPRTWAAPWLRGRSSRWRCCGAFRDFSRTAGRTRSSCCGSRRNPAKHGPSTAE
jgi:hypothetical protein